MTSIVIPHFNRSGLLKDTLQSVINQTSSDWEVILVDDQSTEEEWQRVKSYETLDTRIRIIRREKGVKGPSSCRNLGARLARGEYLTFLDSDDLLALFCIEQRVRAMKENSGTDAGIFLIKMFSRFPEDRDAIFNNRVAENEWISNFLKIRNPWQTMAPIWRKKAFLAVGGFNEDFIYMEDPELHLRAVHRGITIKTFYDFPADCYYRIHHNDNTKADFYYNSIFFRIRFFDLIFKTYPISFIRKYEADIRTGISDSIRTFLYSRKNQFPKLYDDMMRMMEASGIYSEKEIRKYRRLIEWGNTNNMLLRKLKIKGICYKLLPA